MTQAIEDQNRPKHLVEFPAYLANSYQNDIFLPRKRISDLLKFVIHPDLYFGISFVPKILSENHLLRQIPGYSPLKSRMPQGLYRWLHLPQFCLMMQKEW